ncbi:hypothetical protein C5C30_11765 [Rathayibacter sp. AY2B5]|nr:hypothetical protein C5C30_11765 [Rathayibacter sp. AY2B5]
MAALDLMVREAATMAEIEESFAMLDLPAPWATRDEVLMHMAASAEEQAETADPVEPDVQVEVIEPSGQEETPPDPERGGIT